MKMHVIQIPEVQANIQIGLFIRRLKKKAVPPAAEPNNAPANREKQIANILPTSFTPPEKPNANWNALLHNSHRKRPPVEGQRPTTRIVKLPGIACERGCGFSAVAAGAGPNYAVARYMRSASAS